LNFAAALRRWGEFPAAGHYTSFCGESRDCETAEIAVKAALMANWFFHADTQRRSVTSAVDENMGMNRSRSRLGQQICAQVWFEKFA